jgi:hypothetical protein
VTAPALSPAQALVRALTHALMHAPVLSYLSHPPNMVRRTAAGQKPSQLTIRMSPQLHAALRELSRNTTRRPYDRHARAEHVKTRGAWHSHMLKEITLAEIAPLMNCHDLEDRWFYVEWFDAQESAKR